MLQCSKFDIKLYIFTAFHFIKNNIKNIKTGRNLNCLKHNIH